VAGNKHKHWRGFQGKKALECPPMLDFAFHQIELSPDFRAATHRQGLAS